MNNILYIRTLKNNRDTIIIYLPLQSQPPHCNFSLIIITSTTLGTLGSNIARGCSIENAVRNALYCATVSVQSSGAQKSYARLRNIPEDFRPPKYSELRHDKREILSLL